MCEEINIYKMKQNKWIQINLNLLFLQSNLLNEK